MITNRRNQTMMSTTTSNTIMARASAVTDARQLRTIHKGPVDVSNMRGQAYKTNNNINITIAPKHHLLRLATLNVGTLSGRGLEVTEMLRRRRVDICCLQETKWENKDPAKSYQLGNGYKLLYYGVRDKSRTDAPKGRPPPIRNGVGIAICPDLANSITEVIFVSDRIIGARIECRGNSLFVVSAYAPQTGGPDARQGHDPLQRHPGHEEDGHEGGGDQQGLADVGLDQQQGHRTLASWFAPTTVELAPSDVSRSDGVALRVDSAGTRTS